MNAAKLHTNLHIRTASSEEVPVSTLRMPSTTKLQVALGIIEEYDKIYDQEFQQVKDWLDEINMGEYTEAFRSFVYNMSMVKDLDEDCLIGDLNVSVKLHCKIIVKEIDKLRSQIVTTAVASNTTTKLRRKQRRISYLADALEHPWNGLTIHNKRPPDGKWDVFISHTQRHPDGKLLALDFKDTMDNKNKSSWLDIKMQDKCPAAMEAGVKNSKCVIAIITGPCINIREPEKNSTQDQLENAYFSRRFCKNELRWAREAGIPIQCVVCVEDKKQISNFIETIPLDLKSIANANWPDLDRSDHECFEIKIDRILKWMEQNNQEKTSKSRPSRIASEDERGSDSITFDVTHSEHRMILKHRSTVDVKNPLNVPVSESKSDDAGKNVIFKTIERERETSEENRNGSCCCLM